MFTSSRMTANSSWRRYRKRLAPGEGADDVLVQILQHRPKREHPLGLVVDQEDVDLPSSMNT
jgi:hypothetical protein